MAGLEAWGRGMARLEPWEEGVTGNKQWKKGYSVRLEKRFQNNLKKSGISSLHSEMQYVLDFFEIFFQDLSTISFFHCLFPATPPSHGSSPMAQAPWLKPHSLSLATPLFHGLSLAIPLFHSSGLAIPLFHASGLGTPSFAQGRKLQGPTGDH